MGQNKFKRKHPIKVEKNEIHIVCGGATEKIYFDRLRLKLESKIIDKKIKVLKNGVDPLSLVEYCMKIREKQKNCLKIWAVFDRDEFPQFDEAIDLANKNGVHCAFSNQAFELWFINHFEFCCSPLSRKKYPQVIKKHMGVGYEKNARCLKTIVDNLLEADLMSTAVDNARKGHEIHVAEKKRNIYSEYESCTTVYKLIKDIIKN